MAKRYKNEGLNKAVALLLERGIAHEVCPTRGGHLHLKATVGPLKLLFTAGSTPSDARAAQNFFGDVRRGLRQAGVSL